MGINGGGHGGKGKPAEQLEKELADRLTDGPLEAGDKERIVRARLSPKYEIRIQTTYDPIGEETKLYRSMAKELDGRYDRHASASVPGKAEEDQGKRTFVSGKLKLMQRSKKP
ncbi:hypothetical protein BG53_13405 [Paenibacillus darwinianus]|uniref:Uncharacterized protein n=1 Tax=Paenibacillus darwinianus TaxID=1380763 RepID=A0A9W5S2C7_9BACL|nr:hypothetical protein [Paenibacillus darwinianus]EXX87858.1 hypothetical protein CH50_04560 [Paenibacillus darwinianus]EXX90543.1 hypothetical protein BG53_13405 [Paenibacillus darwinianus]EXX90575.1 hypothetical protein BG52_13340 [Paenibacillus darwinianus]